MNIFVLTFINLHPNANFENDTFYKLEQISENEGILKKISSFLIISRTHQNLEKVFSLNCTNEGILLRNNSKYSNSALILCETNLRILEFSFPKEKIKGEVNKIKFIYKNFLFYSNFYSIFNSIFLFNFLFKF